MIDLDSIKARLARVWGKWPTKGVMAPGADEFGPKAWSAHGPLRCHATEQGRARQWTQANADAAFIAAAPADIGALVAEVERLRGVNADLRNMVDGLETAAHEERAAVVAWLQAASQRWAVDDPLNEAADAIERGEHRRKEKP